MSILTRGLAICRPLPRYRLLTQCRPFSICLRHEDGLLRFSNQAYAFPPSPPSEIQAESNGLVPAFLEEPTVEYGALEKIDLHDDNALRSPELQAADLILRLIAKGDIDEALAVRSEYMKAGVEIAKDRSFASAAISELSSVDPEARSRRFIAWWSLAPLEECPDKVALACAKLMDHPFDIPLLMDFCVVSAKSGFAHVIEKSRLLPHIFRYGNPNATYAFLLKLEPEIRKHQNKKSSTPWTSIRNLAIRMHLVAGRKQIAKSIYDRSVEMNLVIDEQTSKLIEANGFGEPSSTKSVNVESLKSLVPEHGEKRSMSELAGELRILRRIVASPNPPPAYFESFLAEFIDAYEQLGRRSRAIRTLRAKVFNTGTLALRARWVAGEQLAYSKRGRSLAVLRTYFNYCLADNILASEARPILAHWRARSRGKPKFVDWELSKRPVDVAWKIWPTDLSMNLAWKALLQLSKTRDIERLYALFLNHLETAQKVPQQLADDLRYTSDLKVADEYYYDGSSHVIAVPPSVFPNASYFHHFVVALSTRIAPRRGAKVLRDMQRFGIQSWKESWGAVAGAYARAGDFRRVLRILDHIDADAETHGNLPDHEKTRLWEIRLVTYNSILRGFTEAAMYPEARAIQKHMEERGFLQKMDKRTETILHRLSGYEKGKFDKMLYRRGRHIVDQPGRRIVIDPSRAEWLTEPRRTLF